ncbi:MAG TPA: oxygenase MpaB family protein, partial [Actinomycetota bacterium]|nr:oxygenase MpaB family protein [Actinomycetota bacterium]
MTPKLVHGSGDEGLFGPGSITWAIHSHPSMLIGGLRSLLYQALNPLAMAGVAEHSNYKEDPWSRLMATSDFIVTTTYGDTEAAKAAIEKVRTIHTFVNGVDEVTGRPYSADDPELLLWVHAAEVDSFLRCYRTYGERISDSDADRYIAEMAIVAELLGARPSDLPTSVAQLEDYLDGAELLVTPAAKEAMRFVLYPPAPWPGGRMPSGPLGQLLRIPGRAGYSTFSLATIAILPP